MSKTPVLPLNFTAMRSLMSENRRLREALETEKTRLSTDINNLQNHIGMAEKFVNARRISQDTYQKFTSIAASLNSVVLSPKLTFKEVQASQKTDLSEELREMQDRYEQIRGEALDMAQTRTDLAVEEQRLNAKRSSYLQEIAGLRRDCDDLIVQKEKIEHEVAELEALCEFWENKNANSETTLKSAMEELSVLQQEKDKQSLQLLTELEHIYATLEEAGKGLHSHSKQ